MSTVGIFILRSNYSGDKLKLEHAGRYRIYQVTANRMLMCPKLAVHVLELKLAIAVIRKY